MHDGGVVVALGPRPAGPVGITGLGGPDPAEDAATATAPDGRPVDQLAMNFASQPLRAWIALGAFCGLRCLEMAALRAEDIVTGRNGNVTTAERSYTFKVVAKVDPPGRRGDVDVELRRDTDGERS